MCLWSQGLSNGNKIAAHLDLETVFHPRHLSIILESECRRKVRSWLEMGPKDHEKDINVAGILAVNAWISTPLLSKTQSCKSSRSEAIPGSSSLWIYSRSAYDDHNFEPQLQLVVKIVRFDSTTSPTKDHWILIECIWPQHSQSEAFNSTRKLAQPLKRETEFKLDTIYADKENRPSTYESKVQKV